MGGPPCPPPLPALPHAPSFSRRSRRPATAAHGPPTAPPIDGMGPWTGRVCRAALTRFSRHGHGPTPTSWLVTFGLPLHKRSLSICKAGAYTRAQVRMARGGGEWSSPLLPTSSCSVSACVACAWDRQHHQPTQLRRPLTARLWPAPPGDRETDAGRQSIGA